MKNPIVVLLFTLLANAVSAQCPVQLLQCPPAFPVAVCDQSNNDALLWNTLYYMNPATGMYNLPESQVDLLFKFRDSCGGGIVGFTLLMDLNSDGIRETALTPDHFLNKGRLLFNNAANPGYSSTDTVEFDHRPVPVNEKYNFVLRTLTSGDTTTVQLRWNTVSGPNQYSLPQLPYGNHKVIWQLQRPDSTYTCEGTFFVYDCKKPTITCTSGLSVNIGTLLQPPPHIVTLWASDFLQYVQDNVTPANQIEIAIEKGGAGAGFPVGSNNQPITSVTFDCSELGPQEVELWARDMAGNVDSCTTYVIIQDNAGNCESSNGEIICVNLHCNNEPVEGVLFEMSGNNPALPPIDLLYLYNIDNQTDETGCIFISNVLPIASDFTVTPVKDDNPLNGVTTYDMVLISKHILGLEPLNTPYKMIAADANKSNSVTTFDIVELRKLIIGIYSELPNNTSWRFVDYNFIFPDPTNPFSTQFPETVTGAWLLDTLSPNFAGIKVGDVNCSAIANANSDMSPENRSSEYFYIRDVQMHAGEVLDVPVFAAETSNWDGFQFSLHNDPEVLTIESVIPGALKGMSPDVFGMPKPGLLNASWVAGGTEKVHKDQPLFTLRARAHVPVRLSSAIRIDAGPLRAEVYPETGGIAPLELAFRSDSGAIQICAAIYCSGQNLEEASFQLEGEIPGTPPVTLFALSNNNGCVIFDNLPVNGTYSVTASKDDNVLGSGVSTADKYLLAKHVSGEQPLTEPWQLIAADLDQNGAVDSIDLQLFSAFMLGIYPNPPISWLFFVDTCDFNSLEGILNCPQEILVHDVTAMNNPGFYAIQLGDLNCPPAYTSAGEVDVTESHVVGPTPNPTGGTSVFLVYLDKPGPVHLELFDPSGRKIWENRLEGVKGEQRVELPDTATPFAGLYFWRMQLGACVKSGRLIKA